MSASSLARRHHLAARRKAWRAKIKAYTGEEPLTITAARKIWRKRRPTSRDAVPPFQETE